MFLGEGICELSYKMEVIFLIAFIVTIYRIVFHY